MRYIEINSKYVIISYMVKIIPWLWRMANGVSYGNKAQGLIQIMI